MNAHSTCIQTREAKWIWFSLAWTSMLLMPVLSFAQVIYSDALEGDFQNWSWGTTVDLNNSAPVNSGTASIAVTHDEGFSGLYLRTLTGFSVSQDDEIRFHIHGGSGGQLIKIHAVDVNGGFVDAGNITLQGGVWNEVLVHFDMIGFPQQFFGFVLQGFTPDSQATYYVDQIEVGDFVEEDDPSQMMGPSIFIDSSVVNRQIDPNVYGLNFADPLFAAEIGLTLNRWGGNAVSRYDYSNERTNLASDFFFENHPTYNNATADNFVSGNVANGTDSILTIGMLDYLPNSEDLTGSYRVSLYGPQQEVNMYRPDHGNGIRLDGSRITDNDPLDTHNPSDESHATAWVSHLTSQFGSATNGGVEYYALCNEPMLWNSTHMDVHPAGASYDEVLATGIRYAEAIKQADPGAQVLGPVLWGWTAYFYSALDAEPGGEWWLNPLDRLAHDDIPFLPWYLQQMAEYEMQNGTRLLDVLDVHYYPQQAGIPFGAAGDLLTQQLRLRSTRCLWDPSYQDESWINQQVQLIPRMRQWIDSNYPGTKLAITEYNWGAHDHITGALAQADVLGVFGREGVDMATLWSPPESDLPAAFAFRMFRNYDGNQNVYSRFGDNSVSAASDDPELVSVFAATRSTDDSVTIMLINKTIDVMETPVSFANTANAEAEVYVYSESDTSSIRQLDNVIVANGQLQILLEPYSITLLEFPGGASVLLGDLNLDGVVNLLDVQPFVALLANGGFQQEGDFNGDGVVNLLDVNGFIEVLSGS